MLRNNKLDVMMNFLKFQIFFLTKFPCNKSNIFFNEADKCLSRIYFYLINKIHIYLINYFLNKKNEPSLNALSNHCKSSSNTREVSPTKKNCRDFYFYLHLKTFRFILPPTRQFNNQSLS